MRGASFVDIVNTPSTTAVDTCKDYECPDGYDRKDDYDTITCKDDCDDDQCCDRGGCAVLKPCTVVATYAVHQY